MNYKYLIIEYINGSRAFVILYENKDGSGWQYINMTKEHICPCKFETYREAVNDLNKYENIDSIRFIGDKMEWMKEYHREEFLYGEQSN